MLSRDWFDTLVVVAWVGDMVRPYLSIAVCGSVIITQWCIEKW
ncbi:hypothetical protein VCSRO72_3031 [Vibrio cholerae]|nr:hypothetical protein VCSRO72_3031 [Vibrio cholerae]